MKDLEFIKKDAFKKELEKVASKGLYMALGAGLAGAGIAGEMALNKYQDKKIAQESGEIFEEIYRTTPELSKFPKSEVKLYFDSLVHHSPRVATDPVSARSFLLQMLPWNETGGVPVDNFVNLAKITQTNEYMPYKVKAGINSVLAANPLAAARLD